MTQVNLFWEGSQFVHHSLAVVNRECCAALSDSSQIDLTIVPYEPNQFEPGNDAKLLRLQALDLRHKGLHPTQLRQRPTLWVRHHGPGIDTRRPPRGAPLILMRDWEYSLLPTEHIEQMRQANEVWTSSTYTRNAMIRSGLSAERVALIPYGVDPHRFSPSGDRWPLPRPERFHFLFLGATGAFRKGVDILLEGFCRAFTSRDDVCLVIKEVGAKDVYHNITAAEQIAHYRDKAGSPEIVYLPDYLPEADIARLYRACDVFVSSYRGEGFSLPTLEAMSSGLPVIVPAGGATDDFVTPECAWRIDTRPRSIGTTIYNLPLSGEGYVLEPDIDQFVDLLRAAYNERQEVTAKGASARAQAQRWTWHHAAGKILQRVDMLCGTTTAAEWNPLTSTIEQDGQTP